MSYTINMKLKCVLIINLLIIVLLTSSVIAISGDEDDDSVIDARDKCPNTNKNEIIVEPLTNIDYAGCTCDQIKEIYGLNDECHFCYGDILSVRDKMFGIFYLVI